MKTLVKEQGEVRNDEGRIHCDVHHAEGFSLFVGLDTLSERDCVRPVAAVVFWCLSFAVWGGTEGGFGHMLLLLTAGSN